MRGIVASGLHLPWPSDWAVLFGRQAKTILEIGFGGGHFLVDLAARMPNVNVLGVEHSFYSLNETERRVHKANLSNVRLIYADARLTLTYIVRRECLKPFTSTSPILSPKKHMPSGGC